MMMMVVVMVVMVVMMMRVRAEKGGWLEYAWCFFVHLHHQSSIRACILESRLFLILTSPPDIAASCTDVAQLTSQFASINA